MRQTAASAARRISLVLAAALAFALAAGAPTATGAERERASAAACDGADRPPATIERLRRLVFCLHNVERRRRGLRALRRSSSLETAARRHARDMVRRRYFDHLSPAGRNPLERVAATRYGTGRAVSVGENILWDGDPRRPSAASVVRVWMKSRGHRANILRQGWRDLGIGIAAGSPFGRGGGVTVVAVFGRRLGPA